MNDRMRDAPKPVVEYVAEMERRALESLPRPTLQRFYEVGPFVDERTCMWVQPTKMDLPRLAVVIGRATRQAEHYRRVAGLLLMLALDKHGKLPPLLSVEELAKLPVEDDWELDEEREAQQNV